MEQKHVCKRRRANRSPQNSVIRTTIQGQPSNKKKNKQANQEELSADQQIILGSSSSSLVTTTSKAPDLPCSILIDILARLPIKTLTECRYVCRLWRSLLREAYFSKLYSHHMPSTLILRVKGNSLDTLKDISLVEGSLCGGVCNTSNFTRKLRRVKNRRKPKVDLSSLMGTDFRFQLGNGCNGLVCVREIGSREPALVWNPIMGQFAILPKPDTTTDDKVVSGFGFCGRTNTYKVVRIFHKSLDPPLRWRVEIYDFKVGNQWREIGDVPYPIPSRIPGFYTNGCLHWILDYHNNISSFELICCFDFGEENFKVIAPPPIFSHKEKNKYRWSNLGIIGSCLSICAIDAIIFRADIQVWVMEEHGVAESWTMRFSISDPAVDWWNPYKWMQVTNIFKSGEILMLCAHCSVLVYNPRERRFRSVKELDFPAIAHVPSFISLENVVGGDQGIGSMNIIYL